MTRAVGRRRGTIALVVSAALVAATVTGAVSVPASAAPAAASQPNILFVLADDLDLAEMSYLPEVQALVAAKGATFDQYFVSDSLCCPSRTTTFRGQYAHNSGVESNGGTNGGFETAYRTGVEAKTIATRLHGAGYRTALFGKYLNGYPGTAGEDYIPPGWDAWASPVRGHPYRQYDYVLNHDRTIESYGNAPADYGTDVYVRMAQQFIRRSVRDGQPFFADVSVYAPHEPATPAPADIGRFVGAQAPHTPSYDQPDVTQMPMYIRDLPRFTPEEEAAIDRLYQRRIESLQAVDRGVADLIATLRTTGQLKNTYVLFASDNGFHLGQHRLPAGKETPYDTDIRVPLVVRGPGIDAGTHVRRMTANTDLAPTFAAMGGAPRTRNWDGRSFLGLARGDAVTPTTRRHALLVEHWAEARPNESPAVPPGVLEPVDVDQSDPRLHPTESAGPNQLSDQTVFGRLVRIPDYAGVRTAQYLYVEYANGDRELYDLSADPDEMHNLVGTDPALEARLAGRVAALRTCRSAGCHTAEMRR